jgi:hypothetical protein
MRFASLILLVFLSGCCTRRDCDFSNMLAYANFNNYGRTELSNSVLIRYDAASGWAQPVDTVPFNPALLNPMSGFSDTLHYTYTFAVPLVSQYNYRIVTPAQQIEITNFRYLTFECNSCLLRQQDESIRLESVNVNGQEKLVSGELIQFFR